MTITKPRFVLLTLLSVMAGWELRRLTIHYGIGNVAFLALYGALFAAGGYTYRAAVEMQTVHKLRHRLYETQQQLHKAQAANHPHIRSVR